MKFNKGIIKIIKALVIILGIGLGFVLAREIIPKIPKLNDAMFFPIIEEEYDYLERKADYLIQNNLDQQIIDEYESEDFSVSIDGEILKIYNNFRDISLEKNMRSGKVEKHSDAFPRWSVNIIAGTIIVVTAVIVYSVFSLIFKKIRNKWPKRLLTKQNLLSSLFLFTY